jgi:hypothetical protein
LWVRYIFLPEVTNFPAPVIVPAITDTSVAENVTPELRISFPPIDKDLVDEDADMVRLVMYKND